jgi:hypothetical protein
VIVGRLCAPAPLNVTKPKIKQGALSRLTKSAVH